MKIVFFSHYFPPEGNAPASRTFDHCKRWAAAGHEVTVITGVPSVPHGEVYEGYRKRFWPQRETVAGIEVVRTWTYIAANARNNRRVINFVSYLFSAVLTYVFFVRRPDVVIATSPQFFCGWAGVIASRLKRARFILEVRDIWPDSIVTVGAMRRGKRIRFLEWLEQKMYRSADEIVAVGNGYRRRIIEKCPAVRGRVSVVTNGVDLERFKPVARSGAWLRSHGLKGKYVCGYLGTIGMAHGLEVVLRAAERLRDAGREDVCFLMVGDGAGRGALEAASKRLGLEPWVKFTGLLPKEQMPVALASVDVVLVHLNKTPLFESVLPSKLFETMAMGRPIILGVKGDAARLVRGAGVGVLMEPENEVDLVEAIDRLWIDSAFAARCSAAGRPHVEDYFTRDAMAARYLEVIESVAGGEPVELPEQDWEGGGGGSGLQDAAMVGAR